jgi:hypothetical protein
MTNNNDKQRIATLETQLADARHELAQLRDANDNKARIIADLRAAEFHGISESQLKSVEDRSGEVDIPMFRHAFVDGYSCGLDRNATGAEELITKSIQEWKQNKNSV